LFSVVLLTKRFNLFPNAGEYTPRLLSLLLSPSSSSLSTCLSYLSFRFLYIPLPPSPSLVSQARPSTRSTELERLFFFPEKRTNGREDGNFAIRIEFEQNKVPSTAEASSRLETSLETKESSSPRRPLQTRVKRLGELKGSSAKRCCLHVSDSSRERHSRTRIARWLSGDTSRGLDGRLNKSMSSSYTCARWRASRPCRILAITFVGAII